MPVSNRWRPLLAISNLAAACSNDKPAVNRMSRKHRATRRRATSGLDTTDDAVIITAGIGSPAESTSSPRGPSY